VWLTLLSANTFTTEPVGFNTTSVAYTTVGGNICGVTIVVPPSGRIRVDYRSFLGNSAANSTLVAPQLNNVVGAGAVLDAAADVVSIENNGVVASFGSFTYYTGLTAGTSVNVFLMHRVTAGTGTISRRGICAEQR
jgi:hypothetical protein